MLAAAAMIPANDARAQTLASVTVEGTAVTFSDLGSNRFDATVDIATRPNDDMLTLEAAPTAAEKVTVCAISNIGSGVGTPVGASGVAGATVTEELSIASNSAFYNYRIYVTTGTVFPCSSGNEGLAPAIANTNYYTLTVTVPVTTATMVSSVMAVPTSLVEGSATTSTITVTLDSTVPESQNPVTLPYVFSGITTGDFSYTVDGTATTGLTGDLVFQDIEVRDGADIHVDSKTIVVTALADDTVEAGGETLNFKLTPGSYNGVVVVDNADHEADITISDTGPPSKVKITSDANDPGFDATGPLTESISEDGGSVTLMVELDNPVSSADLVGSSTTVNIAYTVSLSGGATAGDITCRTGGPSGPPCAASGTSGNFEFAAGEQRKTIVITGVADMDNESGESITVDLTVASITTGRGTLTVQEHDAAVITLDDGDDLPTMVESITVNPASIREAEGEAIITVSLDNAAVNLIDTPARIAGTGVIGVEVTFAIPAEGVADFGGTNPDYTCDPVCTSGVVTLVYSPGQQRKTIRIAGVDDSETQTGDEGPETFTAEVTGTEEEGTGTTSVVGLPSTASVTVTINEITVEMEEVKTEVETLATLIGAEQVGTISGLIRSRFSAQASSGVAGLDTPASVLAGGTTKLSLHHNPQDMGDMLDGLALEHTTGADGGGAYAVWVRGQYSSMEGDPTVNGITVDYDGDSTGLGVGAEKNTGRYVAGVAVNWLTTDLDISSSSDDTTISKYEESLVMVAPYVSLRRGARTFWFSGGYGIGDADATLEEGEGKASADVEVSFASAGADFVLSERGKNRITGGLSVLGTRKVVDPLNFAAADVVIPKITLNTFRAQGEITYSRTVEAGEGRVVRPYIGLATLHDAGDRINDDSHAMDLRGGVDFDGARFDVSLEASTELLREDHKSWSVSGSARYQFAPGGRGASLSLDGVGGDASDIGLEGGYGMMMRRVHRDALLTPFAGMRHGSESGEFSSGMRLAVGGDMDADFRATRAFRDDADTLKLTFRRTF